MNRIAATVYLATALPWAVTALLVPSWWQSPAFGYIAMPLWAAGAAWAFAGVTLGATLFRPVRATLVVAALGCYAVPTLTAGSSIVIYTLQPDNGVSAMGSAIAWLGLGLAAAQRGWLLSRAAHR